MNKIISAQNLKKLGFKKINPTVYEDTFSFDWVRLSKGNSNLEVTTEYNLQGKITRQYTDLNGETLTKKNIKISDLKFLIKIM